MSRSGSPSRAAIGAATEAGNGGRQRGPATGAAGAPAAGLRPSHLLSRHSKFSLSVPLFSAVFRRFSHRNKIDRPVCLLFFALRKGNIPISCSGTAARTPNPTSAPLPSFRPEPRTYSGRSGEIWRARRRRRRLRRLAGLRRQPDFLYLTELPLVLWFRWGACASVRTTVRRVRSGRTGRQGPAATSDGGLRSGRTSSVGMIHIGNEICCVKK